MTLPVMLGDTLVVPCKHVAADFRIGGYCGECTTECLRELMAETARLRAVVTQQGFEWAKRMNDEVERLEDRARRVVRVFWRVRWKGGENGELSGASREEAWEWARKFPNAAKVYRVTVRRKKAGS